MDFSFIIVNHNSEKFLVKCISSIQRSMVNVPYEIIIVQNDKKGLIPSMPSEVINIKLTENKGFGHACNIGAEKAHGDILFFLNPDTEIKSFDAVIFKQNILSEKYIICAPRLIGSSGLTEKWSFGAEPTLYRIIKNKFSKNKNWEEETPVDWVSGAALGIAKEIFFEIGSFDENFFMYWEDVDLCKKTRSAGGKIIRLPEMQVLHQGGQSYEENNSQKKHYYESQNYYFQKYFGVFPLTALRLLRTVAGKI